MNYFAQFYAGTPNAQDLVNAKVYLKNYAVLATAGSFGDFRMGELSGDAGAMLGSLAANGYCTYAVGWLGTSSTFNGSLVDNTSPGPNSLNKVGAGTLTLGGTNTHSGLTTVSAGRLIVNGMLQANTNLVNVSNGAALGGTGLVLRVVNVASNATVDAGWSTNVVGTLTVSSNVTFATGAKLAVDLSGATADLLNVTAGSVAVSGTGVVTINVRGNPGSKYEWEIVKSTSGSVPSASRFVTDDINYFCTVRGSTVLLGRKGKGTLIQVF